MLTSALILIGQFVFAVICASLIFFFIFGLKNYCDGKDRKDFLKRALVETSQTAPLLMQEIAFCKTNPRLCMKVVGKFRDETSFILELQVPEQCSPCTPRIGYVRVSEQANDFVNIGEYILVPATHCVIDRLIH